MVGYDGDNNALTLGDDDSLSVGDYELQYNSTDDQWEARYGRPVGGEAGAHGNNTGAEYTAESQVGEYAMYFDGTNYVSLPDSKPWDSIDSQYTISAWVKADSPSGRDTNSRFWSLSSGTRQSNVKWHNRGNGPSVAIFDEADNTYNVTASSNLNANTWYHIVGVYDGTDLILYIDGSEDNRTNVGTITINDSPGGTIGGNTGGGEQFSGILDDVRVYNNALTSTQVSDLFNGVDVTDGLVAHYEFEHPETPERVVDTTGDIYPKNSVPRSTSSSLIPQGLAEVVSQGQILADDGNFYSDIQTAINNATGWVFIGPGTFSEVITVTNPGVTIEGSGEGTVIQPSNTTDTVIDIQADDVTVRRLKLTAPQGDSNNGLIVSSGSRAVIQNVNIPEMGIDGFAFTAGTDHKITGCRTGTIDSRAIEVSGTAERCVVNGNVVKGVSGLHGIIADGTDDNIFAGNFVGASNSSNIYLRNDANDNIVIGNRVINGDTGINISSGADDNIVANNRVSDAVTDNLNDNGTGTVLDANLTGPSN